MIANRQSGADSLKLDQVRSLFIGQITNWKEVGGKDLPVQIWTFDSEEDIGGLFSKLVMNGQPVTSLARLATSAQVMQQAISSIPGSIGILPHSLLEGDTNVIYKVATVPVLAITKSVPQGVVRDLISCLQENH